MSEQLILTTRRVITSAALCGLIVFSMMGSMLAWANAGGLPDNWLWQPLTGQGYLKRGEQQSDTASENGTYLLLESGKVREIAVPSDMQSGYLRLRLMDDSAAQSLSVGYRYNSGFEMPMDTAETHEHALMLPFVAGMTHWVLDNQNDQQTRFLASFVSPMPRVGVASNQAEFAGVKPEPRWYQRGYRQDHKRFVKLAEGDRFQMLFPEQGDFVIEIRSIHNDVSPAQWDKRGAAVTLLWNDTVWRDWHLYPVIDRLDYWQDQGQHYLASFPMRARLMVPKGRHALSFQATGPMLVRVIKSRKVDELAISDPDQGVSNSGLPLLVPDYDERLFSSTTEGMLEQALYQGQLSDTWQDTGATKAIAILKNRFLHWRDYPVAAQDQIKRYRLAMRTVKWPEWQPYFIETATEGPPVSHATFYKIPAGQAIQVGNLLGNTQDSNELSDNMVNELRISVPFSSQEQHWSWGDVKGDRRRFTWRMPTVHYPSLISSEEGVLDVASVVIHQVANASISELVNTSDQAQWIALEYRSATRHSLDQATWLEMRERYGKEQILALLQRRMPPQQESERTLWYAWLPLIRWLDSSRYGWLSGVDTSNETSVPVSAKVVRQWINALQRAGEYALLIRMLKGVLANSSPLEAWRMAYQWLHEYYQQHDQQESLDGLYILAMDRALNPLGGLSSQEQDLHLSNLALQALKNNLPLMAARLYQLQSDQITSPSYLSAFVMAGLLENLREQKLTPSLRRQLGLNNVSDLDFFDSLLALDDGDWQKLRKVFSAVPKTNSLQQWITWLDDFSASQPALPNLSVTMEPKLSAGTAIILQQRRNLSFDREQVAPGKPAVYEVVGPVNLTLDMRLIHAAPETRLDDWISIQQGQERFYKPIVASAVSSHLQLLDVEGHLGASTTINIRLGQGRHRIAIETMAHKGLVRLSARVPGILIDLAQQLFAPHTERLNLINALNDTQPNGFHVSCLDLSGPTHCIKPDSRVFFDDVAMGKKITASKTMPGEIAEKTHLDSGTSLHLRAMQLLWQWEHLTEKQRQQRVAVLEYDSMGQLDDPDIRAWMTRLSSGFGWQLEQSPVYSPGRVRKLNPMDHGSPFSAIREPLMGVWPQANVRRLRPGQEVTFVTRFSNEKTIHLALESKQLPYRPKTSSQVQVVIDEKIYTFWDIDQAQQTLSINVPPGEHFIRLSISKPHADQWLYIRGHFFEQGVQKDLIGDSTRFYEVSEKDDPLRYYFDRPSLLRIDELRGSKLNYRYAFAPSGEFVLQPSAKDRSLYRVFTWAERDYTQELRPFPYETLSPFYKVSDSELTAVNAGGYSEASGVFLWRPHPALSGPTDHTPGAYVETRQRFSDETAEGGDEERWLELGGRYRKKRSCDDCYTRFDLFGRQHLDQNNALFGAKLWLDGRLNRAWVWTGYQQVLLQSSPEIEGAWYGTASLKSQHAIDETQAHRHEFGLFARYLTADEGSGDDDIFTRYKSAHRFGYRLAEVYQWRPDLDHLLQGRLSLLGNENLSPDQIGARVSWRGQWQPWQAGAQIDYQYFLNDNDRNGQGDATRVGLSLAHHWAQPSGRLWGVDLDLSRALEAGNWSLGLSLSLDWHHGRALRDIRPAEESFYGASNQWVRSRTHHHAMQYEPSQ